MASSIMECYRSFSIEKTEHITRSTMFPRLKINFTFSIKTLFRNYIVTPLSGTGPESIPGLPDKGSEAIVSISVIFKTPYSNDELQEAIEGVVEQAVEGAGLLPEDRGRVVDRVWSVVGKRFRAGEDLRRYTIFYVDFAVVVEHEHVYLVGAGCPRTMIDSAPMECEVDVARAEAERCCCICLEALGGEAAAARMPCKHVFHGGCINEWLRKSHCCPLCRYELPME